jgi:hypothetical protein
MKCQISFHRAFVGSGDAKFVKAIKKDFGMNCKEEKDGEYTTWEIINNKVVKNLSAKDIFKLDNDYGILCFEKPNKIILH